MHEDSVGLGPVWRDGSGCSERLCRLQVFYATCRLSALTTGGIHATCCLQHSDSLVPEINIREEGFHPSRCQVPFM